MVGMPGYAKGGLVGDRVARINLDFNNDSVVSAMRGAARQIVTNLKTMFEPGTGMVGALNWARSQVGKPYLWGGAGPGGYDCSGFMAAITNVIRGRSPYARLGSTATMPWPGFKSGMFGQFQIGNSRGGKFGIGHMAGTLLGVNVESAGGVGVRVGRSPRGAGDGIFNERYSMATTGAGSCRPATRSPTTALVSRRRFAPPSRRPRCTGPSRFTSTSTASTSPSRVTGGRSSPRSTANS